MKARCFALGSLASIAALLGALELALWLRERHYRHELDNYWPAAGPPRAIP